MITDLNFPVAQQDVADALLQMPDIDFKLAINEPTGDFFYNPWVIKSEFKNTVWDRLLGMLPQHGEARLIKLPKKECYTAHADIDNRWHLPLVKGLSFLIDLDSNIMHSVDTGKWYYMNAGIIHSAVNFGGEDRVQLVVRELLKAAELSNPKKVIIKPSNQSSTRYTFDNFYSPLLNKWNTAGVMNSFVFDGVNVSFNIEAGVEIPTHADFNIVYL